MPTMTMYHVRNPVSGEVRYVTKAWATWLKSYHWVDASFEEFMRWQMAQYDLKPVEA